MRETVQIRAARLEDCKRLAVMFHKLWPTGSIEEHGKEVRSLVDGTAKLTMPIGVLVAEIERDGVIGFVEVDLRSHADGCDPAQPVGYVEGWYVAEKYRRSGVGAKLIAAAEEWAREFGCVEMGSDAVIENDVSQRAHAALGYEVVDRCVHFRKRL
ncbi:MAG: GNAT family N-acetyltransferase [Acidobacteria bacterium]|nr:GNAT family N-acetyltransferase [Acidobacteriota bacterium]